MNLMQILYLATEKAAKIAKLIRQEPHLMSLLIEEKSSFDFKTLADVLIQEMFIYYISSKFPSLAHSIKGEESNSFTNTLGESTTVSVCETQEQTSSMLAKVLDGNRTAANSLAEVVHESLANSNSLLFPDIDIENVCIWIDPIDSTYEYIAGKDNELHKGTQIHEKGLECVTILVGVYDKSSGLPIAAVVSQPFSFQEASRWQSVTHWGSMCSGQLYHSRPITDQSYTNLRIVLSTSESPVVRDNLAINFDLFSASGVGYKCLVTSLGHADAYLCSKASTYRWDTNGPHAILRIQKGGIIPFLSLFELGDADKLACEESLLKHQVRYHEPNKNVAGNKEWCNIRGIIAYKKPQVLQTIYDSLKNVDVAALHK